MTRVQQAVKVATLPPNSEFEAAAEGHDDVNDDVNTEFGCPSTLELGYV